MPTNSIVRFTVGPAGTGKSYYCCAMFLSQELLPESEMHHWSNFPYNPRIMADYVSRRTGKPSEGYEKRLHLIPEEELQKWMKEESGPWEFFKKISIENCQIDIDECHHYFGVHHSIDHRRRLQAWLGELRHAGAVINFLTQDQGKVCKEIHMEASYRLVLVNSEDRRDPYFKIPLGDWYELRASVFRIYLAASWAIEKRKVDNKWVVEQEHFFYLYPNLFKLYNSYSKPIAGGLAAKGKIREYTKRWPPSLWWWFIKRNWMQLAKKLPWILFVVFLLMGGGGIIVSAFMSQMQATLVRNGAVKPPSTQSAAPKTEHPVERPVFPATAVQAPTTVPAVRSAVVVPATQPVVVKPVLAPVKVVEITESFVVLDSGERVELGDTACTSVLKGKRLGWTNTKDGTCVFDDDRLFLGVPWVPADPNR